MEAEVLHFAARKFSRGDALYSSLRRSAMQSLVLFLTYVSYVFSRAMGVAFLSFHDDDKQKVNFEKIWVKNPFKKCVKLTIKITIHKKKSQIVGIKAHTHTHKSHDRYI